MKYLVILSLLLSTFIFAEEMRTVELNSDKINIGAITQNREAPAEEEFLVVRKKDSPSSIKVTFNYNVRETVCTYYEYRDVWVPGQYVCRTQPDGRVYCYDTGGYYRSERYCRRWDEVANTEDKTIALHFKKANSLDENQMESFAITIKQKNYRSNSFTLSGSEVDVQSSYVIKETTNHWLPFVKQGLNFTAN